MRGKNLKSIWKCMWMSNQMKQTDTQSIMNGTIFMNWS